MNVLAGGNIYFYSDDKMRSTTSGGLTIPWILFSKASVDPIDASSE